MRARSAAFLLSLLILLASGAQAWAHASLVKAEPADGAVLAQAPAALKLTFNEPVSPLVMRLIGPAGELIALADVAAENTTVTIAAPPALRRGSHALSWRVISADGHPVAGSLIFSIGAPSARPAGDVLGDPSVRAALWAAKVVIYVGLFIGIGGAFFRAWIADSASPAVVPWLVAALAAGLLATPVSVGSLLPLILAVRHAQAGSRALAWFSRLMPYPLGLIVITGLTLAIVQLGRLDALWSTSYGIVLACKLAAVIALLALAAGNRYLLVPRFEAAGGPTARALAISIAVELAIALVILSLVALWRFTPPPRALAATAPISIHLHGDKAMAQIELTPEEPRGARVSLLVLDGEFRPLAAKEVALVLSNVTAGIEALRRAAVSEGASTWRIEEVRIPGAGPWLVRVEILISDFEKVTLEETVAMPRAP